MPAVINDYLLSVDLYRFNVQPATVCPLTPPPVDLVALTHGAALDAYEAGGFTVTKVRSADKAFHVRLDVYHGPQLLGFMLTNPTKNYGHRKHLRPFHVENAAFYCADFAGLIPAFLATFGLEIANHSQLDIALDTQQLNPAKLINFYTSKPTQYQRIKDKSDKVLTIGTKNEATGKRQETTYYHKDSRTVQVKIYDKTQELQHTPKAWLSDWHAQNRFDPSKPVYRVEISIKAKALREYRRYVITEDGEELTAYRADALGLTTVTKETRIKTHELMPERFNQPAYLACLFREFFPVDIRKKDTTRPTNATRVSLIDYAIFGWQQLNSTVATRPTTRTFVVEKRRIRDLVLDYRDTGKAHYLASARGLAERYQLGSHLDIMLARFAPAADVSSPPPPAQRMAA